MIYNKMKEYWASVNHSVLVNQRELILGVAACTLAGIVLGIFLSPKKTTTIGSNNGSNNTGNSALAPAKRPESGKEDA